MFERNLRSAGDRAWTDRPLRILVDMLGIRPLRGLLIALVFVVKTAPVLLFPLYVEHVISTLSGQSAAALPRILWPALALILLQLLNIPAHTLFMHMASGHIRDTERKLRTALIRQLQYLTISYYHRMQSGELQAKVLRDVEQVENLVRLLLTRSFQIVLTIVFAVVVTLVKEPKVLLFYVVAAPLSLFVIHFFRKRLSERNYHFRREMEDMSSSVSEMIDMIPVTRAHGLEQQEITRVEKNLQQIHAKGHRLDRMNALFESSAFMTLQITQVICLMFTGTLAARGLITVAELVLVPVPVRSDRAEHHGNSRHGAANQQGNGIVTGSCGDSVGAGSRVGRRKGPARKGRGSCRVRECQFQLRRRLGRERLKLCCRSR